MEFPILFQLGGQKIALFLKRLIPFVVTQKGFFPLDFSSMWLLQESAEKDSWMHPPMCTKEWVSYPFYITGPAMNKEYKSKQQTDKKLVSFYFFTNVLHLFLYQGKI